MYVSGEGTADGRSLKSYAKGDGRKIEDRKLLEKRRTIGKTYENLGKELFEHAIGYKIDDATGLRKKQKMYHVIARCRVVNAIRKSGTYLPADADELEQLISRHIAEKTELKQLEHGGIGFAQEHQQQQDQQLQQHQAISPNMEQQHRYQPHSQPGQELCHGQHHQQHQERQQQQHQQQQRQQQERTHQEKQQEQQQEQQQQNEQKQREQQREMQHQHQQQHPFSLSHQLQPLILPAQTLPKTPSPPYDGTDFQSGGGPRGL
jgi:flagellar biosynthesis GTPase FlhF